MNEELNAQKKIEKVIDYLADKFKDFNIDDIKKYSSESVENAYHEIFVEGKDIGLDFLEEKTKEDLEKTKKKINEAFSEKGIKIEIDFTDKNNYLTDFKTGLLDDVLKDGFF